MTLSIALCALALLLSILIIVGAFRQDKWVDLLNFVSWLGLVGTMIGLYSGTLSGLATALAAASFGALVALPGGVKHPLLRRDGSIYGALGCGVLALCALIYACVPQARLPAVTTDDLLLYAGQWAALAACAISALVALGFVRQKEAKQTQSIGSALVAAGALVMAFVVGALRSDVPSRVYGVPLSSEVGPVMWAMAPQHGGDKVLGLRAMLNVDALNPLIWVAVAVVLTAGLLTHFKPDARRLHGILWGVGAGLSLTALGLLIYTAYNPMLPDGSLYTAHAQVIGADLKIPKNIVAQGGFATGKSIYILWSNVLVDFALFGLAALIALSEAILLLRKTSTNHTPEAEQDDGVYRVVPDETGLLALLYARDHGARAAMLVWLSWFLGALATWKMHVTYGLASASEWSSLGVCILISGLAWLNYTRRPWLIRLSPVIMIIAILWLVALSFGFGVPPQTALRF